MTEVVYGEVVVPDWAGHSLEENEDIIGRGLTTFVEVGRALAVIRDEMQYVAAGFDTFEDYCKQRWDMGYSYAKGHIDGARVVAAISAHAEVEPPRSEFHARPLVKVLNDRGEDAVVEVWSQIVEAHEGDGPITGLEVRRFTADKATQHKPGWMEMLGDVGDTLTLADKKLARVETAVDREPNDAMKAKARQYGEWAEGLAERLWEIAGERTQ